MSSNRPAPSPPRRYDVTVLGGGIVGQTLALLLARERLRVALVVPPRASGQVDVRAYALNVASRDLLQTVRAWPEGATTTGMPEHSTPVVTPVTAMDVRGDQGGRVQFNATRTTEPALAWIVDVPALEQRLAHAVHFQSGIEVVEDAPQRSALTVVCEGKRSSTRDELGLAFDVRPYPHKAVAARLVCALPHGGVARQWFHDGEIMALLPLDGEGGRRVALVWSMPHARADELVGGEPEALTQAVQARCEQVLGDMQLDGGPQDWPLELSRAQRWITRTAQGGVALAGDAAHAMHPLAGQGLNVGLADVAELARVIHEREYWRDLGDLKLLRRYERARQAEVNAMGWVTDGLFGLFAQPDARVQVLRNWGMTGFDRLSPLKHWLTRRAMGTNA